VRVARAIIDNARMVILVADRLKLERAAPVRIAHIAEVDTFVTDELPSEALAARCREADVMVIESVKEGKAPSAVA